MVGDGVNDSAALALADVGVSMVHGAEIAQESSDVVLLEGELSHLCTAIEISRQALGRIRRGYGLIVGGNSLLLGLSLGRLVSPAASALGHNVLTLGVAMQNMRPYRLGAGTVCAPVAE